jgi:hypothetical protein
MGICWSDPPPPPNTMRTYVVEAPPMKPSAPPMYPPPMYPPQGYQQPVYQNPQYTYATMPQQQYQVPQVQQVYTTYPAYQQQQNRTSPGTAFVGGLVLGAVLEDIMDPE